MTTASPTPKGVTGRVQLLAERMAVETRLREIRAIGHHRGEWIRVSNPPPETERRLIRAARDAIAENVEKLAKIDEQIAQLGTREGA